MTDLVAPFYWRDEAAAYVRDRWKVSCTAGYLAKLACSGNGPIFHRRGNRPAYFAADLDGWAKARISGPKISNATPSTQHEAVA
jgi:hypothetical protein